VYAVFVKNQACALAVQSVMWGVILWQFWRKCSEKAAICKDRGLSADVPEALGMDILNAKMPRIAGGPLKCGLRQSNAIFALL